jgi:hypothetical protein
MQSVFQLPIRVPSVLAVGAETESPAAGAVLAQSSALQGVLNGWLLTGVQFASDGVPQFEVAVRSSANVDLSVWLVSAAEAANGLAVLWLNVANTNYVEVRLKGAGSTGIYYQAVIQGWLY